MVTAYITAGAWNVMFKESETCLTTSGARCDAMRLKVMDEQLQRA